MTTQRNGRIGWDDRVCGAMLAAACGDALGAPFEGVPAPAPDAVTGWAAATAPLRWTDDTALLLATAEHLAATGGAVDDDALARAYAEEWAADPGRGYGGGPPRIFADVLAGRDWRSRTRSLFGGQGSLGNGGAMRVAPAGLLAGVPLADVATLGRRTAAVTHSHPLGQDGAAVQAVAVAMAARSDPGRPLDQAGFLDTLTTLAATGELRDALAAASGCLDGGCEPGDVAGRVGNDVTAAASVPAALIAFLRYPDRPAEAVRFAVLTGGDADTIAAMTGALAGARCGAAGLPASWLDRLEQADRLTAAAHAMAALPTHRDSHP